MPAMGAMQVTAHTKSGQRLLLRRLQGAPLTWRDRAYLFVNEPHSGRLARLFSNVVMINLILCMITSMAESVEFVTRETGPQVFYFAKFFFMAFFTFEGLIRFIGHNPLRNALRDHNVYLDLLSVGPFWMRGFLYPASMSVDLYLIRHERPLWIRILESAGDFRLLKLSRGYYGAELLVRALSRSMRELLIPAFMLSIMVVTFSSVMYDIEWDAHGYKCQLHWEAQGVGRYFLLSHADGPSWGCDVCDQQVLTEDRSRDDADTDLARFKCLTCTGYPDGHPECAGTPFAQNFPDIPRAMWFTLVTVTVS